MRRHRLYSRREGQAAVETAILLPVLLMMMLAGFQMARVFYVYHTLHKAMRGGMQYMLRQPAVNFCDPNDPVLLDTKNFIVFGNLQGSGTPVVTGLTPDLISIFPERTDATGSTVADCPCSGDGNCDPANAGRRPDYVTVNFPGGFPLQVAFPLVQFGAINLKVSVRQPYLGT
jgi:hypothetical protein